MHFSTHNEISVSLIT